MYINPYQKLVDLSSEHAAWWGMYMVTSIASYYRMCKAGNYSINIDHIRFICKALSGMEKPLKTAICYTPLSIKDRDFLLTGL